MKFVGLQANESLDNAERERRLRIVFSRATPATPHFIAAATVASSLLNPVLKNAVIQLLPPDFQARDRGQAGRFLGHDGGGDEKRQAHR